MKWVMNSIGDLFGSGGRLQGTQCLSQAEAECGAHRLKAHDKDTLFHWGYNGAGASGRVVGNKLVGSAS